MANQLVEKFNLLSSKVEAVKDNLKRLQARQTALNEQKTAILQKLQQEYGITTYEQLKVEIETLTSSLNQSLSTMEQVLSKVNV